MARPTFIADWATLNVRYGSWFVYLPLDASRHITIAASVQDITGIDSAELFDVFPSLFYSMREFLHKLEES